MTTPLPANAPLYRISLAQWSLHKAFFGGDLDAMEFATISKRDFGIDAIEYVSSFYKGKAEDTRTLAELKHRAEDEGVKSVLIMVDGEGALGAPDKAERAKSVANHYKWIHAIKLLGGHAIRVNAASSGTYEEQQKRAADGLRQLSEYGAKFDISVIVENHGGYSSNGAWLAGVMNLVDHPGCGTLPDFGNFCMDWSKSDDPSVWYDRYQGVTEMMPYAKAVSAKSRTFDDAGEETETDYHKMMRIVLDAGYRGYVGIEWEGGSPSEAEGIKLTKKLLDKVHDELAADPKYRTPGT